jgi:hypothetical protein
MNNLKHKVSMKRVHCSMQLVVGKKPMKEWHLWDFNSLKQIMMIKKLTKNGSQKKKIYVVDRQRDKYISEKKWMGESHSVKTLI